MTADDIIREYMHKGGNRQTAQALILNDLPHEKAKAADLARAGKLGESDAQHQRVNAMREAADRLVDLR